MSDLDTCGVCKKPIRIMVRRHTGLCCENCEKAWKKQHGG